MYKVVLVDDEQIIVEGLKRAVDWEKYHCQVVGTAEEARSGAALIRQLKPDILFTDIHMPGLDGLAMVAGLKGEFPHLQIAVLTGYRDFDYAARAVNLGVARFLLKPSKMRELEEAIQAMTENLDRLSPPPLETGSSCLEVQEKEPVPEKDAANSFVVNAALKYMEEHYAEKLSLAEVADKVFVSQWHLSKLLNKYTGQGFLDILNQTRIQRGKELLRDPALKIYEISEMLGFHDVTHFSKTFKKLEGQSPGEYRNSLAL